MSCRKWIVALMLPVVGLAVTSTINGQIGRQKIDPNAADIRVKRILDARGLKYEIDEDNDFRVGNALPGERTHLVFINSNTSNYEDLEVREVWGIASISEDAPEQEVAYDLLNENGLLKIGKWSVVESNGKAIVEFSVVIDADTDDTALITALLAVSRTADKMEKKLTGKDVF